MDKEKAKFILRSYRPDGADASDPEFADALQLAASDRELGEWLASERAADAMFAKALSQIEIPEALRDEIRMVIGNDASQVILDELDGVFGGALAGIQPPAGLRDQIVAAMDVEASSAVEHPTIWKWLPYAAAAVLVLSAVLLFRPSATVESPGGIAAVPSGGNDPVVVDPQPVASQSVQVDAAYYMQAIFENDGGLDTKGDKYPKVADWLTAQGYPVPSELPPGLRDMDCVGCKKVKLRCGMSASMICFINQQKQVVHMFVMDASHISDFDSMSPCKRLASARCHQDKSGKMNLTCYKGGNEIVILMTYQSRKFLQSLLVQN